MDLGRKIAQAWKRAASEAGGTPNLTEVFSRVALLFSGGWILAVTFENWSRAPLFASLGITIALLISFAVGVVNVAAAVQLWIPARRLALLVPFSIVYLLVTNYWLFTFLVPFYTTDGIAYDHYSAIVLLQGLNPYTVDQSPAFELFQMPAFYVTPTEAGGIVTKQTYPALSFLLYAPLVLLGVGDMRIASLGAHALAIFVVYGVARHPLKAFAPLTLAFPNQLLYTAGSVQDILWVTPLLLSISLLGKQKVSGSLYGIACSIKPLPWLLAPFLFVYLWKREGTKFPSSPALWSFVGFAAGWFLLLNGPFIVWDPVAWTAGVFDPLLGRNVPLGSGLSTLTQAAWVPLPREFYLVAMAASAVALLSIEFHDFRRVEYLVWWFPAIIMFFGYRSLANYFMYWYPFVFIALAAWFYERCRRVRAGGNS